MRFLLPVLLLLGWQETSVARGRYFQQECDMEIQVRLDDHVHRLFGFEKMHYVNHSPDTLHFIYMHAWPNAYKNDRSRFCEQEVENGNTTFYYSREEDRGFMDSLQFQYGNQVLAMHLVEDQDDMLEVELPKALLPGEAIDISTPFRVQVPKTFSRLGYEGHSYQITQWYPKPAVYDHQGWHPMPYLDQGEFYSEYGSYHVRITLPASYVVAATGDLQEESEKNFLLHRQYTTDTTKALAAEKISVDSFKTITFVQDHVHDFAWFADPDYKVEEQVLTLASGRQIHCRSYYRPASRALYRGSAEVIAGTVSFLSKKVGEYPYAHASIVEGCLKAGEGMEYPNVAVIGSSESRSMLRTVIIHEVGHNWFYGLLGSDERTHPWMDEGMNSYYEKRISRELPVSATDSIRQLPKRALRLIPDEHVLLNFSQLVHEDQAIDESAPTYTPFNYNAVVYEKSAEMLRYLSAYLGPTLFDSVMKSYFAQWHFKHPQPDDFYDVLASVSHCDMHDFINDGFQHTKAIDFSLSHVTHDSSGFDVNVHNRTGFRGPLPVSAMHQQRILETRWIEPVAVHGTLHFNLPADSVTAFRIDAEEVMSERRISNNIYHLHKLFPKTSLGIRAGSSLGLSIRQKLFLIPAVGYNFYDKGMAGLVLHNILFPNHPFQFALMPLYASGPKSWAGSGFASYTVYPSKWFQHIRAGIFFRSYHEDETHLHLASSLYARYLRIRPSLHITLKKKEARSPITHSFECQYIFLQTQTFQYNLRATDSTYIAGIGSLKHQGFYNASWTMKNKRTLNPYGYQFQCNGNSSFMKLGLQGDAKVDYRQKGHAFYARVYAGKYLRLQTPSSALEEATHGLNLTSAADADYLHEDVFLARHEQQGWYSQQINGNEGGFKVRSNLLANPIGRNNNWLAVMNLRSDLPFKLPVHLQAFLDMGIVPVQDAATHRTRQGLYDGGLACHLFGQFLSIYVPVVMSSSFQDYLRSTYPKNRLLHSMSFSMQLASIRWEDTQHGFSFFR